MKKELLSVCTAFAVLALGAADLRFYTGGDKPWTQKDGVWTSPDLKSLAAGKPESWLELEVEGPCTVSFKLSMDSDRFQNPIPCSGGWLGLSIYSDEDWFGWSSGSGNYFAENSIKIYESGTHFVRWEISSSGYDDSVYGQDICKVKDVVVTPAPSSIMVKFNPNGGSGSVVTKRFSTVDASYDDIPTPTYYGCEFLGWFTEPIGGYPLYEGSQVRFDDPTTYYAHWSMPLEDALGTAGGAIEVWRNEYYYDDEWEMWHGVPGESHDGYGAACVDGTSSSQYLYARVSGSGTLSFWWRTLGRSHGSFSGGSSISYASTWDPMTGREIVQDGEWQKVTVQVHGAGEHQVWWSGYRSSSSSDESDRGGLLVDDLEFTPAPKTVVVVLDANGGVVDQRSVELETSGTYGSLPVPRRAGWEFDGWFTDPVAGYLAGEDRPVRFDQLTLYAHWSIPLEEATGVSEAGDISLRSGMSGLDAEAWFGTLDDSHDGYGAAASRAAGSSETLYGSATGRGTLTFWWKTVGDEYVSASCDIDHCNGGCCLPSSYDDGATSEAPSIMSIKGTEWQKASMEFYLDQDHEFRWSASGKVLVDEIKWIPAVEPMKVRFMTGQYVVYKEQTYNPGDKFGGANCSSLCSRDECVALVADPVREGYVFGGWYLDPEFVKPLHWYAYVPYTGATVYAKWMRPLAAAKVGDLQFKNVAPLDPLLAAFYPTTVWDVFEYTYTTGAEAMQTELGGVDWDGWETSSVSTAEATVGSGFLDLLWSVYPYSSDLFTSYYSSLTLYVDGKEVATQGPFDEPDSRVRVALGQGTHKVHVEAIGEGVPALVTDVKLTAITPADTVGEWLGRVKDYHYWTKNNLSPLKSAAAAAQKTGSAESRYKAAIEHALTTLLALGEDPLVASTMKKFGFTLDLETLSANGAFSYAQAPAFNTLVNDVFAKAQPVIETALADLESIPSSWDGTVRISADDYPIDDDIAIDYGDVLYLRSALKGALGAAYWVKAYSTEFDWKKFESDVHGLKLTTPSSAPTIGSNTGWSEVGVFATAKTTEFEIVDLGGSFFPISGETATEKIAGEGVGFRAAWCRNKLYLKIDKSDYALEDGIQSLTVSLGDGALKGKDAHFTLDYFPEGVGTLFGESFPEAADRKWVSFDLEELFPDVEFRETETSWMVAIDLEGTKCAKDTTLRYVRMLQISSAETEYDGDRLVSSVEFELEYDAFKDGVYMAANSQTKMFDKVRDQAALAKSKASVADALALAQSADQHILRERTYGGNCLVNYDDRDEDKLQAMREQVATAKDALDAPQEVDWTKGLDEKTVERFGYLDNPIKVNLGALFGGRVTRGLIPNTLYPGEYAPAIDEMPDATMGGLLPEMATDRWVEYAEAEGLHYRNEEFGLVVPDSPYELTPGAPASIELAVAGCGADAKVTVLSSSLPAGMRYDATKRIISGTPTKPGVYSIAVTVTSGTRTSTKSLAVYVAPFPALELVIDDEDAERAGCTVSGGGNYMSGTKVTLKATVAKGWVFTGWDGLPDSYVGDCRNPSAALVTDAEDREIYASFCRIPDDWLDIDDPGMVEYALNEPVTDDMTIFDAVHSGSLPTITVKDLPTGLKFDAKTGAISGKPTKEEFKFVTVSAKNAGGYTFTRVLRMSVGGAEEPRKDEAHGYLNLQWFENINVGYAVDQLVSDGFGATVSGLPTGLKYDSKTGIVTGTPTKPGVYTVKATMKDPYDSRVTLTSEFRSIVQDGGSRYVEVLSDDNGTSSGSGVYAAGATFKPTAKAANGYVFAGWMTYDPEDYDGMYPVQQTFGADWRNPSQSWIVNGDLPTLFAATFVAKNAGACDRGDTYCEIVPFEGNEWYADTAEGDVYFNFAVESASLPKITVKGLPSGITFGGEKDCVASPYDDSAVWYRLKADSAKPPKPGVYDVEISAENQSKAKAEKVTVRITVPNWRSDVFSGLEYDVPYLRMVGMNSLYDEGELDFGVEEGWTVTQSGLPAGMKFTFNKNEAWGHVSGTPSKAGNYTLILTAKKGAQTEQASVTFVVEAFPEELAGTFNGFVTWEDWCDPLASVGTFTLTSGKDGKISAKASYDGTSVILTATGWSLGSAGIARVSLEKSTTKSGCKFYETMDLSVDLTQPWDQWQVAGPWWHDYSECAYSPSSAELYVSAQRSPYGKVGTKYENPEAHDIAATLAKFGQMAVDLEESGDGWYEKACGDCGLGGATSQLKFTVKDTGTVSVAGKLGTVSVSGSTTLTIIEEDGFAGYCIKVGSKMVRIKVSFDESGISQCNASIEDTAKN